MDNKKSFVAYSPFRAGNFSKRLDCGHMTCLSLFLYLGIRVKRKDVAPPKGEFPRLTAKQDISDSITVGNVSAFEKNKVAATQDRMFLKDN